jgi:hypothetical protein
VKQNSTCPIKTAILCYYRLACKDIGIDILNYLDDLAGCESPETSWDAFNNLGHILDRCGFEESVEKACPPNTKIIL